MATQSTNLTHRPRRNRSRRLLGNLLYALVLALVVFFLLTPFLWMVLNAFKTPLQIIKLPPELIFQPTLRNFENVFGTQNFMRYILNSVIIGGGCTLVGLLIGLPAAYSIARYRQNRLAVVILMARMVPGITFLVPLFIIFRRLGLIDTYTSLILAHMLVGLPFIVWVMVPFFESIPRELTEAAVMDGASALRTFVTVVLPLSGPGIVTASILSFVFSWNNFMFSIVLASNRTRTVPVAIYNFISYAQIDWGGLMAAAVVITLPVLVLAIITQRYVIRGLTAGAVKG
ncbi:MAG: carbohydrate ABC transporter permease [Caldilineaceae bacterium]|jgi:multiple sugar transport system permease protein|nr:carbohydrate ABC transporter permease [Caldilineaceae bacterium]